MKNKGYYESFNVKRPDGTITKFEVWIPAEYANNNIKSKDDLLKEISILESKILKERLKLENPYFIQNAPNDIIEKSRNKVDSFMNEKELIMKYLEENGY